MKLHQRICGQLSPERPARRRAPERDDVEMRELLGSAISWGKLGRVACPPIEDGDSNEGTLEKSNKNTICHCRLKSQCAWGGCQWPSRPGVLSPFRTDSMMPECLWMQPTHTALPAQPLLQNPHCRAG